MVENYLLAQFNKSNGNKLVEVGFSRPLQVQYGAYAVQKGNGTLVRTLNTFICSVQGNGQLARIYEQTEGTALPPPPNPPGPPPPRGRPRVEKRPPLPGRPRR